MSKILIERELLERIVAHLEWDGDEPMTTIQFAQKCDSLAAEIRDVVCDPSNDLASQMRAAGMLTVDEMLSGAPLDRFIRHAGVHDLETYGNWLDMKCREFLSMQASRELDKREDDDLYEWVLAHAAAFQEARINFNATK